MPDANMDLNAYQALAAAAAISEIPCDDLEGYVLIAVTTDQRYRVSSNLCCSEHTVRVMTRAASAVHDAPPWENLPGCR